MKKILSIILLISFCLTTLSSCALFLKPTSNNEKIRVGYLTGPTGMGMAKFIVDNNGINGGNEKYSFISFADNTEAAMTALANGSVDIICFPANVAAVYPTKTGKNAKIIAVNCLNSLYLISENENRNSLADFEGETIYTCKNGTPKIVLETIIKELGLNIEVSYVANGKDTMDSPTDVRDQMLAGNIPNAVLPEPLISAILLKRNSSATLSPAMFVSVDLSEEWAKLFETPITMGCLLANGDFVNNHKDLIDKFLTEYTASVEYISNPENFDSAALYIQESGVIPALPIARSALKSLSKSIVCLEGDEMKKALETFYLKTGIALPNEQIYYAK